MSSAYQVLGVPSDASAEDIDIAFDRAKLIYMPRLAKSEGSVEKFNDVKVAYQILSDPESRKAHDRKLAGPSKPRVSYQAPAVEEVPMSRKMLTMGIWLVALVIAGGVYVSYRNNETRKEIAAQELAASKRAAEEAERARLEAERLDAERAQAKAKEEANERRATQEARGLASRAANDHARAEAQLISAQRQAAMEATRREAAFQSEQRQLAAEARQRVAADKQRIRELCYQQYRRPDC